jgi:hypothetical protein
MTVRDRKVIGKGEGGGRRGRGKGEGKSDSPPPSDPCQTFANTGNICMLSQFNHKIFTSTLMFLWWGWGGGGGEGSPTTGTKQ